MMRRFLAVKFAVRTSGDPMQMREPIRRLMHELDPSLPLTAIYSMEQVVARSVAPERFNMSLLGLFAALGLLLAAIGLYGVMSYTVTQRTHEIGIRMAMGAQLSDVLKLVLGQGMKLAVMGLVIGLLASLAVTRLMRGLLFGVSATDPLTLLLIA